MEEEACLTLGSSSAPVKRSQVKKEAEGSSGI